MTETTQPVKQKKYQTTRKSAAQEACRQTTNNKLQLRWKSNTQILSFSPLKRLIMILWCPSLLQSIRTDDAPVCNK